MKKLFLIPLCLILIVACKKETFDTNLGEYDKYPYSSLSIEEQKDKLAAESDAILSSLNGLQNEDGIKVLKSFFYLLNQSYLDIEDVLDFDEDSYIINVKDMNGEFTWNTTTESWDKKALSGKIIFNFPVETSTTNNGKVEITGAGSGNKGDYYIDGESGLIEIPKNLKLVVSLSSKEVASYELKATDPNVDNIVNDATVKIALGNYVISTNTQKEADSKVSSTLSIKAGSNVIIDAILSSTINWEYVYEYETSISLQWDDKKQNWVVYDSETETDTIITLDFQNVELSIGSDLAIVGYVNLKEMNSQFDKISKKYRDTYGYDPWYWTDTTKEAAIKEEVAAYNANIKMILVSKKDKYKIASLKFGYTTETYGSSKYFYIEPILVFNDKTEASLETFFGEGFDKVIDAWMNFFMSFE